MMELVSDRGRQPCSADRYEVYLLRTDMEIEAAVMEGQLEMNGHEVCRTEADCFSLSRKT